MKKTGILNPELMKGLTSLGHLDRLLICDAGFPIPVGVCGLDVSLVAGVPSFEQVFKAVLEEVIFEEYFVFDFMKTYNEEYYLLVTGLLKKLKKNECSMDQFRQEAQATKFCIRCGDLKPASNILLVSASGVEFLCKPMNVSPGLSRN